MITIFVKDEIKYRIKDITSTKVATGLGVIGAKAGNKGAVMTR